MSYFEFPHTRTYDSDLAWLIKEYKELTTKYDGFQKYVEEWINKHNQDYSALLYRVNTISAEMQSFESEMESKFDTLKDELTVYIFQQVHDALATLIIEIGDVRTAIQNLRSDVQREIIEVNAQILAANSVTRDWVEARLQQFINSIPDLTNVNVWNPVVGKITSIDRALSDIYSVSRTDALTAEEYDSLELSATDYDGYSLTAIEYDNYAKSIFGRWGVYRNPLFYMYSPFTGEYEAITSVINELAAFHLEGAITAEAYDLKELTAQTYDDLELSAYDYDTNAINLLP